MQGNTLFLGSLIVLILGFIVGGQVNRGIYRLAWNARPIGPWRPRPAGQPRRSSWDYIPIIGWWRMRREWVEHGRGFWIRPALIELALGIGLCWLFRFELQAGLWPLLPGLQETWTMTLVRFIAHSVLICLMVVATFIDIDEKTIPDSITIPGTCFALIWMTCFPGALLPDVSQKEIMPLWFHSPNDWDPWFNTVGGLWVAVFCWTAWCYALLPKTWFTRYGMMRAVRFLFASMARHPWTGPFLWFWLAGCLGIGGVWWLGDGHWRGLLTSLLGLAYGGGIVWAVRVIGTAVLKREAMGFGDVTLMAMIGAFLGWQPALIIFFVAPFAGALIAIVQRLVFRRDDIAYGPFLCLATLVVLVFWRDVWMQRCRDLFLLGAIINAVLAFCVVMLAVMLIIWQMLVGLTRRTRPARG
jgi:prepilin signal peptidase PulO-like enzyme (type II secretory pathway)